MNAKIFDYVDPGDANGVRKACDCETKSELRMPGNSDQTYSEAILEGGVPLQMMISYFGEIEPLCPPIDIHSVSDPVELIQMDVH